jgi:hypothetical protein
MAASEISICSNALILLGAKPISSFTSEGGDRALLAGNLFPTIRDYILRKHPWNCATKRVALAPDADNAGDLIVPAFDWDYQYSRPGDWQRTLSVGLNGCADPYVNEGKKILSDANPLYLRYIFRNEDISSWDPSLVYVVQAAMKAAFAYAVTESTSQQELCIKEAADALKEAKAIDGSEDPPDELGDFPTYNARMR